MNEIKRVSAKEAVIRVMEDYIAENGLGPGDSLPTELELSKRLSVSRSVLREALQYFRTLGIIGTKPKSGAYIKSLTPENPFGNYLRFMTRDKRKIREAAQLRMLVELGMVDFLAEKRDQELLNALETLAENMRTASGAEQGALDIEFHTRLLEAPQNELLSGLIPLVVDFFEKTNKAPRDEKSKSSKQIAEEHSEMVSAMKNGDGNGLRTLIREHYAPYLEMDK